MLRKVLLLEDERRIIEEMNQQFARAPHNWDLAQAGDSASAWQHFVDGPVDIIIARITAADENGAGFWRRLIEASPQTVRLAIASSRLEPIRAAESLQYTHQCLSEDIRADLLIKGIDFVVYLQNRLANLRLEAEIGGLLSLQALPDNYIGIIKELQSPEPSVKKISGLIQQDMAMTARVLQLVNSAFFSLPNRVAKVDQAVSLLGISTIRSMLVSMQLFSVFEGGPVPKRHAEQVWEHSVKVAGLAREIAAREGASDRDQENALLAGMLHDIGKLILFKLPEYREALTARIRAGINDEYSLEKELYGSTHAEAGGYLIGIWGINSTVAEIVAHHHKPAESRSMTGFTPLTAVHAADFIIHNRNQPSGAVKPALDESYMESLEYMGKMQEWSQIGV